MLWLWVRLARGGDSPLLGAACRAAAARRTYPLDRCINIAPPFTGSRTLTALMGLYSPYAHHDHRISVDGLQRQYRRASFDETRRPSEWPAQFRGLPRPAPCYVIERRPLPPELPSHPFHPGRHGPRPGRARPLGHQQLPERPRLLQERYFQVPGVRHVERDRGRDLRRVPRPASPSTDAPEGSLRPPRFFAGAAVPVVKPKTGAAAACWGLDLATTARYLGGLDCASAEVHYVCTETLVDDFAALAASLGANASRVAALAARANLHVREAGSSEHAGRPAYRDRIAAFYGSALDAARADRARALFPHDAALHAAFCPPKRAPR